MAKSKRVKCSSISGRKKLSLGRSIARYFLMFLSMNSSSVSMTLMSCLKSLSYMVSPICLRSTTSITLS